MGKLTLGRETKNQVAKKMFKGNIADSPPEPHGPWYILSEVAPADLADPFGSAFS